MNIQEYYYPEIAAIIQEAGREPKDVQSLSFSAGYVGAYNDRGMMRFVSPRKADMLTITFRDGSKGFVDLWQRPVSWVEPEQEEEEECQ